MIRGLNSGERDGTSFDPEYKSDLFTKLYGKLFDATEAQETLPTWVRLGDTFEKQERGVARHA